MKIALIKEKKRFRNVSILQIATGHLPTWWSNFSYYKDVVGPFFIFRFLLLPVLNYNAFVNLIMSEILANVYSFTIIVTNHAGDDLYRFTDHVDPLSDDFYLRQVIGSVDFTAGNEFIDFIHSYLNYQIEHHLWPDLSALSYKRAHPHVKAICKKHGVPFIQENVFIRLWKLKDIFVGNTSMKIYGK